MSLAACSDYGVESIDGNPDGAGERLLQVWPEALDFGEVAAGDMVTDSFTITSTGTATVELEPLHVHGSGAFTFIDADVEGPLAPGEFVEVVVAYGAASASDEASAVVGSDAQTQQINVPLTGAGVMPDLVFDPQQVLLQSFDGSAVYGSFVARNEGLVDLVVDSWVLQGERFTAETDLPGTLAPGEETTISVSYTPLEETSELGYFWASSNDPDGSEVATLEGLYQLPCLGLHEAVTRGYVDIRSNAEGIIVEHEGEDEEICIDRWYVYISEGTQDAGAGDPSYVADDVYGEEGSIELTRGDQVLFTWGTSQAPAWWCVEQTQLTDTSTSFHFTGAQVPSMLLDTMLGTDFDPNSLVWADMRDHPIMIVGRERGWASLPAGGSTLVEVEVVNMGRVAGVAAVSETIPAGMAASNFDLEPFGEDWSEDGSVTYSWEVELAAAEDTADDTHTIYDSQTISYVLQVNDEACLPRTSTPEPWVSWEDSDGTVQEAAGSPLIIECW